MAKAKQLIERMKFADLPQDWNLRRVSVDWSGEPLLLFDQGKPKRPPREPMDAFLEGLRMAPESCHLLHWNGSRFADVTFDNQHAHLHDVQRFGDGWLLSDVRGGNARIYNSGGTQILRTLDLGDASEQIHTTEDGHIWVSYFDEGVFGGEIGSDGLVCFDADGNPVFKYADFATTNGLPYIDDCYAMNVAHDAVWICYYSEFPLVCIKDYVLNGVWREWSATKAFAIRGQTVVRFPAYRNPHVMTRTFSDPAETTWALLTPNGESLSAVTGDLDEEGRPWHVPFECTARGERFYIWTESALYEFP